MDALVVKRLVAAIEFGDSSLDFVVRFWIYEIEAGITNIQGAALLAIWDALKANHITIPYPHLTLIRRISDQAVAPDRTGKEADAAWISADARPAGADIALPSSK